MSSMNFKNDNKINLSFWLAPAVSLSDVFIENNCADTNLTPMTLEIAQ